MKMPGSDIFARATARTRIAIVIAAVVILGTFIYVAMQLWGGGTPAIGTSAVVTPPQALQTVAGGTALSPEYYRALQQANTQRAQEARKTGTSAVQTIIRPPGEEGDQGCTIVCPSEEEPDVARDIDGLVNTGKISQDTADGLLNLAKKNVTPEEYAATLDALVRAGKLTPEQARQLLKKYQAQYRNRLVADSAKGMDSLVKAGQLPLDAANDLIGLQKGKSSPEDYNAALNRLVKEGKISPAIAAQLRAQYAQQQGKEAGQVADFRLRQMAGKGEITPKVAKTLSDFQKQNLPIEQYQARLQQLVKDGNMTPAAAEKVLAQYTAQKTGTLTAAGPIADLIKKGGPSTALAKRLVALQGNNVSLDDYTNELKRAVQAGTITPDMAGQLLQNYQAHLTAQAAGATGVTPGADQVLPGGEDLAKLQQRLQQQQAPESTDKKPFEDTATQIQAESEKTKQDRIQQIQQNMMTQATSLTNAWQPPAMTHAEGTPPQPPKPAQPSGKESAGSQTKSSAQSSTQPILIKAGTIMFAILDTAVNSDYPDTPVLATIIQGPYKGSKLLGKLSMPPGKDRVTLNFSIMNRDDWDKSRNITAFAMDPDTARTVLASNVDYHYLVRYGALFGSSFLSGYSNAVLSSGSTQTTGIFGTTTTRSALSPGEKLAVGLGQVGTNLSSAAASYVNTPPTVKVNSGVGLGILFVADVTS